MTTLPLIPAAMRAAKRWHVWKAIPNTDPTKKARKVPFYVSGIPRNGQLDAPADVAQLATFEEAARATGYTGLGFALGDGWQGVDLDGLSQRPELLPVVAQLVAITYCEMSPSGNGIHAIGYGAPFASMGSTSDGIEAYAGGRFFTVTGQAVADPVVTDLQPYVESELRPRRGAAAPRVPSPPVAAPSWVLASVTPEQVVELRSALCSMRSDDRSLWVDIGMALRALGEQGRSLWMEWSAQSDKFDSADASRTWESLRPTSTDYRAVFAKAQVGGWVNPKSRPVAVPLPPAPVGASAPVPTPIPGGTFAGADVLAQVFAGCTYVQALHKILVPGGELLDAQRFNATHPFNRYSYSLDVSNEHTTRKAFEAFTQSQIYDFPQAQSVCFRPESPPGAVIDGLANTWWPIQTECAEGGVEPFLEHLERMLPHQQDRDVLLAYMAAVVQFPGDKFQWWPLLQGAQGNGKTLLLEVLEHCVGHKYCHRPNAAEIANGGGKFTAWLDRKVFIGIEEVKTSHKAEVLEILKPIITNDRIEIQAKGVDQIIGDNRANGMLYSNYKDAIAIAQDDRRYAVFYTAQQDLADVERCGMGGNYFPQLYRWLRQEGGKARVNNWLRQYQIPAELSPALANGGMAHRAPATSSTEEAITVGRGRVEQEVLEAIAEHRAGFCGGWVNSIELDTLLRDKRLDAQMPRIKRPDMLKRLGYVHHPGLHHGRCTAPTHGTQRPVLYVKVGHIAGNIEGGAAITRAYNAAQMSDVFQQGLDGNSASG